MRALGVNAGWAASILLGGLGAAAEAQVAPTMLDLPPPQLSNIPAPVRAMIDQAIADGDAKMIDMVLRLARRTNPDASKELDAIAVAQSQKMAEAQAARDRQQRQKLATAAFYRNWNGEIELGASRATGNTDDVALYASVKLNRKGIRMTHQIDARVDRQQSNDIATADRQFVSYLPRYNFDPRFYSYGLAQYEHDRFLGYEQRYTGGVGFGYAVIQRPNARLQFEGGPVLRYTHYVSGFVLNNQIDRARETSVAARASIGLRWNISPTLLLTHDTALFVEQGNTTAALATALDTKVIGRLKARISYNVQYEQDAPDGRDSLDTTSRATLVYSF